MRRNPLLIGTIIYAVLLTALLVMPMSGTHIRRGYLREFALRSPRHVIADVVTNVALFVPLGLTVHRMFRRLRLFQDMTMTIAVVVIVALYSLVIETVQYFLPTRYSSMVDVFADTVGASLGAWLERRSGDTR
jgi:VanZ family protein